MKGELEFMVTDLQLSVSVPLDRVTRREVVSVRSINKKNLSSLIIDVDQ